MQNTQAFARNNYQTKYKSFSSFFSFAVRSSSLYVLLSWFGVVCICFGKTANFQFNMFDEFDWWFSLWNLFKRINNHYYVLGIFTTLFFFLFLWVSRLTPCCHWKWLESNLYLSFGWTSCSWSVHFSAEKNGQIRYKWDFHMNNGQLEDKYVWFRWRRERKKTEPPNVWHFRKGCLRRIDINLLLYTWLDYPLHFGCPFILSLNDWPTKVDNDTKVRVKNVPLILMPRMVKHEKGSLMRGWNVDPNSHNK